MGMADFYIKITFHKEGENDIEKGYEYFKEEKSLKILDLEIYDKCLCLECKFDNFIPSIIMIFDGLCLFKDSIESIETYGIIKKFDFDNIEDFLNFIFKSNKLKLLSYYNELGFFALNSDSYYRTRNKLKKYYRKLFKREADKK